MFHGLKMAAAAVAVGVAGMSMGVGAAVGDGLPDRYAPPAAYADAFKNFQIKVGASVVVWDDNNKGIALNGANIAGADAHVKDVWLPTATLTYFFSRNIAAELFCCFAHANVHADGTLKSALGQDRVADTWTFPPILTLQYHFDRMGPIKPYVGAGVQWIHYFSSDSDLKGALAGFNHVKFHDSFGPAVQAGLDIDIGRGWSLGLDVKYVWESTKLTFTNGAGDRITTRHELNPLIVTANVGYRFNLDELLGGRRGGDSLK